MEIRRVTSYTCFFCLCLLDIVDSFMCRSGTSLGKVNPPDSTLNCVGALIEKCSVVYTNNAGNEIWMFSCAASSSKCGDKVIEKDTEMRYCCCEKEKCNDAEFAERCSPGLQTVANGSLILLLVFLIKYIAG